MHKRERVCAWRRACRAVAVAKNEHNVVLHMMVKRGLPRHYAEQVRDVVKDAVWWRGVDMGEVVAGRHATRRVSSAYRLLQATDDVLSKTKVEWARVAPHDALALWSVLRRSILWHTAMLRPVQRVADQLVDTSMDENMVESVFGVVSAGSACLISTYAGAGPAKLASAWKHFNDLYMYVTEDAPASPLLSSLLAGPHAAARAAFAPRENERDEIRTAVLQLRYTTGKLESHVRVCDAPDGTTSVHPFYNRLDGRWHPKSQLPMRLIADAYASVSASSDPVVIIE